MLTLNYLNLAHPNIRLFPWTFPYLNSWPPICQPAMYKNKQKGNCFYWFLFRSGAPTMDL